MRDLHVLVAVQSAARDRHDVIEMPVPTLGRFGADVTHAVVTLPDRGQVYVLDKLPALLGATRPLVAAPHLLARATSTVRSPG